MFIDKKIVRRKSRSSEYVKETKCREALLEFRVEHRRGIMNKWF